MRLPVLFHCGHFLMRIEMTFHLQYNSVANYKKMAQGNAEKSVDIFWPSELK